MRLLVLSLCLFAAASDAYKILVYNPKFGHSHGNIVGGLSDILAEAGHNVTSLIPIIDARHKDGTTKSTHVIHLHPSDALAKAAEGLHNGDLNLFEIPTLSIPFAFGGADLYGQLFARRCVETLANEKAVLEQLRDEHFDVYITEDFDNCGVLLAHVLQPKALIVMTTSFVFEQHFEDNAVPQYLSYNPSSYTYNLDPHSFTSRAWNIYGDFLNRNMFSRWRKLVESAVREQMGADYPSVREIVSNAAYYFTNSEPLVDFAQPTHNRIIDIGGLGVRPPKKLDEHWEEIMGRRDGAILMSFGSIARSAHIRQSAKDVLLRLARTFPNITFIWKYEFPTDEYATNHASKVENLHLAKWTPQSDLLAHEKMRLFITHGGMGSVQDASQRGVPGIFVPLFGDQPRNAAMMEYSGLGKVVAKDTVDVGDTLIDAVREILNDESYSKRAKEIAHKIARKPFSSRELLIKHVEFAAEFGPSKALRPRSYGLTTAELYNLDVYFVFGVALTIFAYLIVKIAYTAVFWALGKITLKQKLN